MIKTMSDQTPAFLYNKFWVEASKCGAACESKCFSDRFVSSYLTYFTLQRDNTHRSSVERPKHSMSDLLHGMADHIHHLEKVCPVLKSALINQAEEQLELSHAGSASNSRKPDRYAATAFRARERCSGWCLRLLTGLHLGSLAAACCSPGQAQCQYTI